VGEHLDILVAVAPANPQGASLQEDRIMSRTVTIPQGLLACTLVLALSAGAAFANKEGDIDGTQGRANCPGPDNYGYTCDPDCAFEFIDISTTGTLIASAVGDDVVSDPVAIDPFDFYGTIVNAFQVSSNGFLSTNAASSDLINDCPLGEGASAESRIAALWDDLETDQGLGMFVEYFAVCPRPGAGGDEPCTIFMWHVNHFSGPPLWLQEVILYHTTSDIVLQIGDGEPEMGSGATSGIQNFDGTDGLTVVCDTPGGIPNNSAFCIRYPRATPVVETTFGQIKAMYR